MMDIKLVAHDNEGELLIDGRLDSASSPEAEKILRSMTERFDKLTLNLANLEYISSAGLRVMKLIHIAMNKKGGKLVLKNTSSRVMEVFEMTGFSGLLHFE